MLDITSALSMVTIAFEALTSFSSLLAASSCLTYYTLLRI